MSCAKWLRLGRKNRGSEAHHPVSLIKREPCKPGLKVVSSRTPTSSVFMENLFVEDSDPPKPRPKGEELPIEEVDEVDEDYNAIA